MPTKAEGKHPLNSLPVKLATSRFGRLPSSGGMFPVRPVDVRNNSLRFPRFPNSGGILPVRDKWESWSVSKSVRLPSSAGIPPVKAWDSNDSFFNPVRFPISGGMLPSSVQPRPPRSSKASTRRGEPATLMPRHLVMGNSRLQFNCPVSPARVSRIRSSISQSRTKSGLLFGLGTTLPSEQAAMSFETSRQSEYLGYQDSREPPAPEFACQSHHVSS